MLYSLHALVDFLIKELQWEAAQMVTHLLCKHKDSSSNPQHSHKKPDRVAQTYYPSPSEAETGGSLKPIGRTQWTLDQCQWERRSFLLFPLKTFLVSFKTSLPAAPSLFLYVTLAVFEKQHKGARRKRVYVRDAGEIPLGLQSTFQPLSGTEHLLRHWGNGCRRKHPSPNTAKALNEKCLP